MKFANYAQQGVRFGATVPYDVTELVNADGSHPILHLEHMGAANASWLEEMIARSKAKDDDVARPGIAEVNRANQDAIIKHCARRLDRVFLDDGTAATDDDIPDFIRAMPAKALMRLMAFVLDESNFCTKIAGKPAELAEK
jgi:hypothetical protein